MTLVITITSNLHIQITYSSNEGKYYEFHLNDATQTPFSNGLIIFNSNQILIQNEEMNSNGQTEIQQIRFLNDLLWRPQEFPIYTIQYQKCEYHLVAEVFFALIIKEFINSFNKKFQCDQTVIVIDDSLEFDSIGIERLYKSLDLLNLTHEEIESPFLQKNQIDYKKQKEQLIDILIKKNEFDIYQKEVKELQQQIKLYDISNQISEENKEQLNVLRKKTK